MLLVVQVLAALAGLLHVYIFVMESVRFADPKVHQGTFKTDPADLEAVKPWAYNQGWYNLFLAIGALLGAVLVRTEPAAGWTLVVSSCGSMLLAALVLVARDRSMASSALKQGLFPLLALVFAVTQL